MLPEPWVSSSPPTWFPPALRVNAGVRSSAPAYLLTPTSLLPRPPLGSHTLNKLALPPLACLPPPCPRLA
eukprot:12937054-Prorocentrum_lima.AAC.1